MAVPEPSARPHGVMFTLMSGFRLDSTTMFNSGSNQILPEIRARMVGIPGGAPASGFMLKSPASWISAQRLSLCCSQPLKV